MMTTISVCLQQEEASLFTKEGRNILESKCQMLCCLFSMWRGHLFFIIIIIYF
jgi:hypothetical protein